MWNKFLYSLKAFPELTVLKLFISWRWQRAFSSKPQHHSHQNDNFFPSKCCLWGRQGWVNKQLVWLYMIRQACEWQMREGFTPLHFTRVISDPVRRGQNSHWTLLMPSHGLAKRWLTRMLSEMLPPHSGLLWTWNDCIDPDVLLEILGLWEYRYPVFISAKWSVQVEARTVLTGSRGDIVVFDARPRMCVFFRDAPTPAKTCPLKAHKSNMV